MKNPAERQAAAIAVAVWVAAGSYTAQRVVDAWGAADGLVLVDAWVGYFWRVGLSILHGGLAGLAVGVFGRETEVDRVLRASPRLTLVLIVPMAAALWWAR